MDMAEELKELDEKLILIDDMIKDIFINDKIITIKDGSKN